MAARFEGLEGIGGGELTGAGARSVGGAAGAGLARLETLLRLRRAPDAADVSEDTNSLAATSITSSFTACESSAAYST